MSDQLPLIKGGNCRSHFSSERHIDVQCGMHIHFHMEIVIVTKGTLNMVIGSEEHEIQTHQIIFVPPLIPHSFISKKPNHCHVIMFSEEFVPAFFDHYQRHPIKINPIKISEECFLLTDRNLPKQLNHPDLLTAQATVLPLCLEITKQCERFDANTRSSNVFINALEYINLHYSEELSLKKVARAIGVHPVTLSKRFSKHSTVNFSSYLNFLRCTHAAEIIRSNGSTITEVAYSVGFNTIRSFNRAFKETFGVTPSTYKKSPSSFYHN